MLLMELPNLNFELLAVLVTDSSLSCSASVVVRMPFSTNLLSSASEAWELAKSRYQQGSASFIELSEAELSKTEAEIQHATAKYDTEIDRAQLQFQTGALRFVKPSASTR